MQKFRRHKIQSWRERIENDGPQPSEQIDPGSPHHMQRNHTSTRSLQVVIRSSLSIDERLALGNAAGEFPEARHADLGAAEQPPWKRDGASCGQR